jgi:ribonucleoside-diphosphate reductase alpha chain
LQVLVDGKSQPLDVQQVRNLINAACVGLTELVDAEAILTETLKNLYHNVPVEELYKSAILAARAMMEKEPAYSQVTARLLLHTIRREVFGSEISKQKAVEFDSRYFP